MAIDPIVLNTIVTGAVGLGSGLIGALSAIQIQRSEANRREKSARRARLIRAYSGLCECANRAQISHNTQLIAERTGEPVDVDAYRQTQLDYARAVWQVILVETDSDLQARVRKIGGKHFAAEFENDDSIENVRTQLAEHMAKLNTELFEIIRHFQRVHLV